MGIYAGPAPRIAEAIEDMQVAVGEAILPALQRCIEVVVSQQNTNKQTPRPNAVPYVVSPSQKEWQPAAVGKTERLGCQRCGDTPPRGAEYCIACGAKL